MLELLAFGFFAFVVVTLFVLAFAGLHLVLWLILLPFRALGWAFQAVGVVLALPFLLLLGILGVAVFGIGAVLFLLPAIPFVLLGLLVWALVRRRDARGSGAA